MASDFHTHNPSPPIRALISAAEPQNGKLVSLQRHPWQLPDIFDQTLLPQKIQLNDFAALGEIGLDYHYDLSPRDIQRETFEKFWGRACGVGT